MIHEIGLELQARLRSRGVPLAVVDGPEPTQTTTFGRERIVIEHDLDGNDGFGSPHGQRRNGKQMFTRSLAVKLTIYAQSPKSGALVFEHRRRAEQVLDQVLVGLDEVSMVRRNSWSPSGGRFVLPEDLADSEKPKGAVYVFTFTFDRGVREMTWAGDEKPEVTVDPEGVVLRFTATTGLANGPEGAPVEYASGG